MPLERRATVIDSFSNAPEQIREVIDTHWLLLDEVRDTGRFYSMKTHNYEKLCSGYISGKSGRFIEIDEQKSDAEYGIVFRHEYGHYIDDVIGIYSESKSFDEAFKLDKRRFDNSKDKGIANLEKMLQDLPENASAFESRYISDILSALTTNGSFVDTKVKKTYQENQKGFYDHEWWKYKESEKVCQNETFANLFAIYTENNSDVVAFAEKWFPNLTEQFQIGMNKSIEYEGKELIKV